MRLLMDLAERTVDVVRLVSDEVRRSEDQVRLAFQAAEGRDYQDFFRIFAEVVGLDIRAVRRAFVRIWLGDPQNVAFATQSVTDIAASVNRSHL
jgi:hypothetical protein